MAVNNGDTKLHRDFSLLPNLKTMSTFPSFLRSVSLIHGKAQGVEMLLRGTVYLLLTYVDVRCRAARALTAYCI